MEQWSDGAMERWSDGAMERWSDGAWKQESGSKGGILSQFCPFTVGQIPVAGVRFCPSSTVHRLRSPFETLPAPIMFLYCFRCWMAVCNTSCNRSAWIGLLM